MTAKQYLNRLRVMHKHIDKILERKQRYKFQAYRPTSSVTALRNSGTDHHSQVEDGVIKLIMAEEKADHLTDELVAAKREALALIECMAIDKQRQIIMLRYIEARQWEDICAAMNCSCEIVNNWHGKALIELEAIGRHYDVL